MFQLGFRVLLLDVLAHGDDRAAGAGSVHLEDAEGAVGGDAVGALTGSEAGLDDEGGRGDGVGRRSSGSSDLRTGLCMRKPFAANGANTLRGSTL